MTPIYLEVTVTSANVLHLLSFLQACHVSKIFHRPELAALLKAFKHSPAGEDSKAFGYTVTTGGEESSFKQSSGHYSTDVVEVERPNQADSGYQSSDKGYQNAGHTYPMTSTGDAYNSSGNRHSRSEFI